MSKDIGVIVGRFQTPYLHKGHDELVKEVWSLNDKVLIFIGSSPLKSTGRNPLTYEQRAGMFKGYGKAVETFELHDTTSDEAWSSSLDKLVLKEREVGDNITLYGSRDSFIPYYDGIFKTEEIAEVPEANATELREGVPKNGSKSFREGVIFGAKNRWINAVPCVDIAIISEGGTKILLGKKIGESKWRLPGGFVDAGESWEEAAIREVMEETLLYVEDMEYRGSFCIDDWRYRSEEAKVTTTLFMCRLRYYQKAKASDDLESVGWFDIEDCPEIIDGHKQMLDKIGVTYANQ